MSPLVWLWCVCLFILLVSLAFADGAAIVLDALNTQISFRKFDPNLPPELDKGVEVSVITANTVPDFSRDLLHLETAVFTGTSSLDKLVTELWAQTPANVLGRLYKSTSGNGLKLCMKNVMYKCLITNCS